MATGHDIVSAAPKYIGQTYERMDCQKFVETVLSDCGIRKDLPGSNAWFRFVTWTGSPEECKKKFGSIPPGAFLFILEQNGKEPEKYKGDGIGNASHIGIYTGLTGQEMIEMGSASSKWNFGDGAIHSSSTHGHVCTSKFAGKSINGGWNRIGLWNAISYGEHIDSIIDGKDPGGETMTATVFAENGTSVKMRKEPSTACGTYWDIPIGTIVTVLEDGDTWSQIQCGGLTGYMMTKYLIPGEVIPGDNPSEDSEFVSVPRADLERVYDLFGDWLGRRG